MTPVKFPECNVLFGPPKGMTKEQVNALPALAIRPLPPSPTFIISCWEMSDEEFAEFSKTRKLWLAVISSHMAPVNITVTRPFDTTIINEVN